jgi:hypothetical protein
MGGAGMGLAVVQQFPVRNGRVRKVAAQQPRRESNRGGGKRVGGLPRAWVCVGRMALTVVVGAARLDIILVPAETQCP